MKIQPHHLPPANYGVGDNKDSERWTPSRKALVVDALMQGVLTLNEALSRYRLSAEELQIWFDRYKLHGTEGLQINRIQDYRDAHAEESNS